MDWPDLRRNRLVGALALLWILLALPRCDAPPGPAAVAPPPDVIARGETLYRSYCQSCHGDRDGAGRVESAPLHGQGGHTWHHSSRNLLEIIRYGSGQPEEKLRQLRGVAPESPKMPGWRGALPDEDTSAVLAYIKTWWTPEQRRFQERLPYMSPPGWRPRTELSE